ncbi:MAG: MotA/TolQ/ExbB proton channel family protein [Rhodospirillales bacterium]|nr:MotA/TolQ/ExbB proton channel family protein [Rhodospirillales bacterium]
MDITTVLGLIIGIVVVTLAILTGSDLWIFLNLPGFLIVIGGTFAATLIKFPLSGMFVAFTVGIKAAFVNEHDNPRELIDLSIRLTKRARKSGLLSLEKIKVANSFFKKGIQLCVDGRDAEFIRKMLTKEMDMAIMRQEVGEKVFAAIGDSAPAFGMFGTLVGLVQMLSTMSDPTSIGRAMAVALLTTLYGVLIAHLIALPISEKLRAKSLLERENRLLIIEGIVQIHDRQNPTVLVELLEAYLPEKQRLGGGGAPESGKRRNSGSKSNPAAAALRRRTAGQ